MSLRTDDIKYYHNGSYIIAGKNHGYIISDKVEYVSNIKEYILHATEIKDVPCAVKLQYANYIYSSMIRDGYSLVEMYAMAHVDYKQPIEQFTNRFIIDKVVNSKFDHKAFGMKHRCKISDYEGDIYRIKIYYGKLEVVFTDFFDGVAGTMFLMLDKKYIGQEIDAKVKAAIREITSAFTDEVYEFDELNDCIYAEVAGTFENIRDKM